MSRSTPLRNHSYTNHPHGTTDGSKKPSPPSRLPRPLPKTPASSVSLASSTSYLSTPSQTSRKRHRPMSSVSTNYVTSPFSSNTTPAWSHVTTALAAGSPPPMVNTNYTLKGGMDTPSLAAEKRYDNIGFEEDGRFQRGWKLSDDSPIPTSSLLGGDRNGRSRTTHDGGPVQEGPSWGSLVLGVVGGVVGGVWAFCKNSAFNGFHAGGGQSYELRNSTIDDHEHMWEDELVGQFRFERLSTPVPGEYPEDTSEEDARPAKRVHTDGGGWIVVSKDGEANSRGASPRLRTPSHHRPPVARASASRRSLVPVSRARPTRMNVSHAGSPAQHQSNPASFAQPRSPTVAARPTPSKKSTPISAEAKRYAARVRREEKLAEEKFELLNDRLQDMIRQGREALGSKVEVVDDDESMGGW